MLLFPYPPGSIEPVADADARVACRIDGTELDAELVGLISAAREQAEHITGRYWRLQVQRVELADWPAGRELLLDLPAAATVAISYRSAATPDDWTALASDQIRWGALGHQTSIRLRAAVAAWPELADATEWPDRLRIDVTVGPADVATVPASVQRYILASVAAWLEQPAAQRAGQALSANPLFERLLDAERLWH
jgi:uncharacterized phiE125 gp8 family phage protein